MPSSIWSGETALKAFTLKNAALKASYPFPGNGACNDIAVAPDGTVYATDTSGGRVLRLKKGPRPSTSGSRIRSSWRRPTESRSSQMACTSIRLARTR